MKRFSLLTAVVCLAFNAQVIAQNNILLKINHVLAGENFAFNTASETPDGRTFDLDRMEYYISEISVTHDGGSVTPFDSLWILVDAAGSTNAFLGSQNIDSVESIAFSIGVDPDHNHLDPSTWPSSHPLYHQSPSMHWGWTAGYRFVAMEGMGAASLNQVFEVHALGDGNYFETSVDLSAGPSNGNVTIELYADYAQALSGVNTDNGLISHGATGSSITVLQNFRDHVFTSELQVMGDTNDSVPEIPAGITALPSGDLFSVYPNPAVNGTIQFTSKSASLTGTVDVYNVAGALIAKRQLSADQSTSLNGFLPGIYVVQFTDNRDGMQQVQKVVVQ